MCTEYTFVHVFHCHCHFHFHFSKCFILSVTLIHYLLHLPQVLEYERDYMCTKCRHVFTVQADFDQFYTFAQLVACPNPDGCNSYKFSCLSEGSEPAACKDYQEIKIQEQVKHFLTTEPMDLSYGIVYFYI